MSPAIISSQTQERHSVLLNRQIPKTTVMCRYYTFHWPPRQSRSILKHFVGSRPPSEEKYPQVCEKMMWENSLEVLTVINPSEIKWKGIPFVRSIVDDGLDHEDMEKMEKFRAYFDKFLLKSPCFIVTWNIFGHYKNELVKLQWTNNGLERYNGTLNSKFQGKQSLLSFITVLEVEAREQVTKLDKIHNGNIVNKKRKRVERVNENDLALKIPSFYHIFNP